MSVTLNKKLRRQRAASLIEYSLLIAVISLVSVASLRSFSTNMKLSYEKIGDALSGSGGLIDCAYGNPGYPGCLDK